MNARIFWKLGAPLLAAATLGTHAHADTFPSQAIRIIVPYAAGGGSDITSRVIQNRLGELLKQPLVIDNRAGGGTLIGTRAVQIAPPDGYTVGVMDPAFLTNPSLMPDAKYDPLKDFTPISLISVTPMILAVTNAYPAKDLKEMVGYAKAHPGKLNYGSPGSGSAGQLAIEQFRTSFGLTGTHIPYKGSGPAGSAIVGGEIDALMSGSALIPLIQGGRIRGIAVTGSKRLPSLPDVPTFAELGYPKINVQTYTALVAPAGTPQAVVQTLQSAVAQTVKSPDMQKALEDRGQVAVGSTPEELAKFFRDNHTSLVKVVHDANIKME
ncbi:MAG: tripartite tricarboxylate transporter substrate binding protein [Pseudomonadota bacterium]